MARTCEWDDDIGLSEEERDENDEVEWKFVGGALDGQECNEGNCKFALDHVFYEGNYAYLYERSRSEGKYYFMSKWKGFKEPHCVEIVGWTRDGNKWTSGKIEIVIDEFVPVGMYTLSDDIGQTYYALENFLGKFGFDRPFYNQNEAMIVISVAIETEIARQYARVTKATK